MSMFVVFVMVLFCVFFVFRCGWCWFGVLGFVLCGMVGFVSFNCFFWFVVVVVLLIGFYLLYWYYLLLVGLVVVVVGVGVIGMFEMSVWLCYYDLLLLLVVLCDVLIVGVCLYVLFGMMVVGDMLLLDMWFKLWWFYDE